MKKAITKKEGILEQKEYVGVLLDIKKQIEASRNEAFNSINLILNKRNWVIGKIISEKQLEHNWGSGFVEKLAQDIQNMYPGVGRFSRINVFRMKAFFKAYQKNITAVTQIESLPIMSIPWGHNVVIFDFLMLHKEHIERDLEQGLIDHVQKMLLEMGKGFV